MLESNISRYGRISARNALSALFVKTVVCNSSAAGAYGIVLLGHWNEFVRRDHFPLLGASSATMPPL